MKQKKIKVTIVTVNFNNGELTEKCVRSFDKVVKKNIDLSMVIVDNGSVDNTSKHLEEKLKNVKFIYSKTNLGYAGGNNLGINYAIKNGADYVLLINNDATIEEKSFITKMISAKGDIISPVVRYKNKGVMTIDYGGMVDNIFGRNTHLHSLPKITPDYYSGVCLLVKTDVFIKNGVLDDKYFLYYEDADFCLRAKKNGFKLGFSPESSIYHDLSSSANKFGKRKTIILANSHLRFCFRHLPIYSAPFYLAFNLYLRFKTLL